MAQLLIRNLEDNRSGGPEEARRRRGQVAGAIPARPAAGRRACRRLPGALPSPTAYVRWDPSQERQSDSTKLIREDRDR